MGAYQQVSHRSRRDRPRISLGGSAGYLLSHHRMLMRTTRSDLKARYAGSVLGVGWIVLGPGLILGLYAVIYAAVFRVRVPSLTTAEFVLFLFCGLVPFLATAEALARSVSAVVTNKAVLSNTIYPIDLTPVNAVLVSSVTLLVGFAAIIITGLIVGALHLTTFLLPVVLVLQLLGLIGVGWIVSILNVVFRDFQNLITVVMMALLIASPIAFTPDQVPATVKPLILLNPFAYYVRAYQDVVILGVVPSVWNWLALLVISFGAFALGSWAFSRAKRVIVDYV
jgi:lipopolysaccharide transport system permease protein